MKFTTARESKAALITLDDEMLLREAAASSVLTATKWLQNLAAKR